MEQTDQELDLAAAVEFAVLKNRGVLERRDEYPTEGGYLGPSWTFSTELRGHSQLVDLSAGKAVETLTPILEKLAANGNGNAPKGEAAWVAVIGDRGTYGTRADPREQFLKTWGRIEPRPMSPIAIALHLAVENPVQVVADELYRRFLSLCLALVKVLGSRRIPIAVRAWGLALGCSNTDISAVRRRAQADGFLRLVSRGSRERMEPGKVRRMADEFDLNVEALTTELAQDAHST